MKDKKTIEKKILNIKKRIDTLKKLPDSNYDNIQKLVINIEDLIFEYKPESLVELKLIRAQLELIITYLQIEENLF